jgi:hypothetical protein
MLASRRGATRAIPRVAASPKVSPDLAGRVSGGRQGAFVTQRYLESVGIGAMNNDAVGVTEQLGLMESERAELAEVNARFLQRSYAKIPDAMLPDRRVGEMNSEWVNSWSRRYKALGQCPAT